MKYSQAQYDALKDDRDMIARVWSENNRILISLLSAALIKIHDDDEFHGYAEKRLAKIGIMYIPGLRAPT